MRARVEKKENKIKPFLDLFVSFLHKGHTNLLCVVSILLDVPEGKSLLPHPQLYKLLEAALYNQCGTIHLETKVIKELGTKLSPRTSYVLKHCFVNCNFRILLLHE